MANTRSFKPKTQAEPVDVEALVGATAESNESKDSNESKVNTSDSYDSSVTSDSRPPYRSDSYGSCYRPQREYSSEHPMRDVPTEEVAGYLDIMPEGHGFLRPKYTPSDRDVYISASQIRRFNLRGGDYVEGGARQPKENERYFGLLQVNKINSKPAESFVSETTATGRPRSEEHTSELQSH